MTSDPNSTAAQTAVHPAGEHRIAVATMCSGIDPAANLAVISGHATDAAGQGARMLFLPEMAVLLDRDARRAARHVTEMADNPLVEALGDIAKASSIWLHAGSLPVLVDAGTGRRANRSLLFDDQGRLVDWYDKIYLFDVDLPTGERWRESDGYVAGDRIVVAETPLGAVGMTICYDIRFGRLFDGLADAGATMIAIPAAFTVPTGLAHWHILCRARAIETGAFVIAATQSGRHADGRETFGHSLVIDPWGRVLVDGGQMVGLQVTDINLRSVDETRRILPTRLHRRIK